MGELASPSSRNAGANHLESNVFIYLQPSGSPWKNSLFQNIKTQLTVQYFDGIKIFYSLFIYIYYFINYLVYFRTCLFLNLDMLQVNL